MTVVCRSVSLSVFGGGGDVMREEWLSGAFLGR